MEQKNYEAWLKISRSVQDHGRNKWKKSGKAPNPLQVVELAKQVRGTVEKLEETFHKGQVLFCV